MNRGEIRRIEPGLYVILWKHGGMSFAAVGVRADGMRWLAPCNWIEPTTVDTVIESWEQVESVHLICSSYISPEEKKSACKWSFYEFTKRNEL